VCSSSLVRPVEQFRVFFFFQAEDGILDRDVTGVQTCALPIFSRFLRNKHILLDYKNKSFAIKD